VFTQAPPSSVVKCLWEVFVCGFGVVFFSCVCVAVSGVLFSVGVCVCDLLIESTLSVLVCSLYNKPSVNMKSIVRACGSVSLLL